MLHLDSVRPGRKRLRLGSIVARAFCFPGSAVVKVPVGRHRRQVRRPAGRWSGSGYTLRPMSPSITHPRLLLPWLSLLVVWVVWGSTYLAMRVVVREMPPFGAAGVRFLCAGTAMALVALVVDRKRGWPTAPVARLLARWRAAAVGWQLVRDVAERTVPSGIAALIVATVPVWILLLDGLRPGGRSWTLRLWIGTAVGLAGVALVARPQAQRRVRSLARHRRAAGGVPVVDDRVALRPVGAAAPAAGFGRRRRDAGGGAALALASWVVREDWLASSASPRAWGGIVYLVLFGSLVGFTAFAYCLNELPASTVGTYAYVNPMVAVVLGFLILGEPLTPGLLAGGTLIILSVVLTTLRKR